MKRHQGQGLKVKVLSFREYQQVLTELFYLVKEVEGESKESIILSLIDRLQEVFEDDLLSEWNDRQLMNKTYQNTDTLTEFLDYSDELIEYRNRDNDTDI